MQGGVNNFLVTLLCLAGGVIVTVTGFTCHVGERGGHVRAY